MMSFRQTIVECSSPEGPMTTTCLTLFLVTITRCQKSHFQISFLSNIIKSKIIASRLVSHNFIVLVTSSSHLNVWWKGGPRQFPKRDNGASKSKCCNYKKQHPSSYSSITMWRHTSTPRMGNQGQTWHRSESVTRHSNSGENFSCCKRIWTRPLHPYTKTVFCACAITL
jgi:hypothetical protein